MGAATTKVDVEAIVRHLAMLERASASEGEREAAEWIAGRLRELGLVPRVEEERVHGTYWIPFGVLSGLGLAAGLAARRGRRRTAIAAGAFAAAAMWEEVGGGRQWFRRRFLSRRPAWNVVAETGDVEAPRTLVLFAHHDAARSGLIFHPGLPTALQQRFPQLWDELETSPPLFPLIVGGPAAVALGALLGSRRLAAAGTVVSAGCAVAFANIAASSTVPGANDNLTGVATLVALAERLAETPVEGLRVVLLSAGSEESFQEGVTAYLRRHGGELPTETTLALCVDTVGSPLLVVPEAEGMLVMREYDGGFKELLSSCAAELAIPLRRGLRFAFSTDAIAWERRGYRTAMLGSVNDLKTPANYHWPSDHADNVDYDVVEQAVALCETVVRRIAAGALD